MGAAFQPLLFAAIFVALVSQAPTSQKDRAQTLEKIRTAKTVFFDDQTRVDGVGDKARAALKKWGRYKLVKDPTQADLILLLSASAYKGGYIVYSGGQTGSVDLHGQPKEDVVPNYCRAAPVRVGYLTAIDPKTSEPLWSGSHQWGGLLTGFDSVGTRLVNKLKKETK